MVLVTVVVSKSLSRLKYITLFFHSLVMIVCWAGEIVKQASFNPSENNQAF